MPAPVSPPRASPLSLSRMRRYLGAALFIGRVFVATAPRPVKSKANPRREAALQRTAALLIIALLVLLLLLLLLHQFYSVSPAHALRSLCFPVKIRVIRLI